MPVMSSDRIAFYGNIISRIDELAFATTFKAKHNILTAMGKLNPHSKTLDSNPSPGAYFDEPSTSLKALAGESRVEVATTNNMDKLTESETKQKQKKQKMMMIITTTTTTTDTSKSQ